MKAEQHGFVQVERAFALPFAAFGLALAVPNVRALFVLQAEQFHGGVFLAGIFIGTVGAFMGFPYALDAPKLPRVFFVAAWSLYLLSLVWMGGLVALQAVGWEWRVGSGLAALLPIATVIFWICRYREKA
jgi:hypothetical protein